jgi:hypothetical protein
MTRRKQQYLASFSPFPEKHNNGAAALAAIAFLLMRSFYLFSCQ